jgi:hypothetical protein
LHRHFDKKHKNPVFATFVSRERRKIGTTAHFNKKRKGAIVEYKMRRYSRTNAVGVNLSRPPDYGRHLGSRYLMGWPAASSDHRQELEPTGTASACACQKKRDMSQV